MTATDRAADACDLMRRASAKVPASCVFTVRRVDASFLTGIMQLVENGLYELVAKILTAVSFIAIGGGLAIVFFFVFAQVILGSHRIQHKLESLDARLKQTNELLERISRRLGGPPGGDES